MRVNLRGLVYGFSSTVLTLIAMLHSTNDAGMLQTFEHAKIAEGTLSASRFQP